MFLKKVERNSNVYYLNLKYIYIISITMSQYNGVGNPFPTKEQFRVYKLMQRDRINKRFNLVKFYRYDIPDDSLNIDTVKLLVSKNKSIKLKNMGALTRYQFEEWVKLHRKQTQTPFTFPKITDKKNPTKDCSWLLFKYKDIIGELKIDVDATNTIDIKKPHYKIDMVRISAARNTTKHRGQITNFKTWPGVTTSKSGEAIILMAILGKFLGDMINGEVERLHWHGTLSSYWTRKDFGKCWQIPGLCEEDYGRFKSRESQKADIESQIQDVKNDITLSSSDKRQLTSRLKEDLKDIYKMYRFNSQILYYWATNFLRKWNENFSRTATGEPYKQILKDITEELISDEKGKDKLVRRKIVTEGMPCICKTKRQRGAGRKRKTRKRKKRKRKSTRKKKRKKN